MNPGQGATAAGLDPGAGGAGRVQGAWLLLLLVFLTGCSAVGLKRPPPRPGKTTFASPLVLLPVQLYGNLPVVEVKGDRGGPYRFLVDTGSSVTLTTPAFAKRNPGRMPANAAAPRVRVAGADGRIEELPAASVRRIELGDTRFDDVPVLLYDCAALSAHLGVKLDGVLGFPFFREAVLTLDYPGRRLMLQPAANAPLIPGTVLPFDDARKTPLISIKLGDRSVLALIDSGSDMGFSLNPVGLGAGFLHGPVDGATVGTLGGDRVQKVGRLDASVAIGDYVFPQPVVDLTDELSAVGGGALRHFAVTFDQARDRVTFYRDSREPLRLPARRTFGLSFTKTPAYWRVAGVVARSPAAAAGVVPGDLVTRINDEPVARWDLGRYEALLEQADAATLTFLQGTAEARKTVAVVPLVP